MERHLETLPPDEEVAVYVFDLGMKMLQRFTADRREAKDALELAGRKPPSSSERPNSMVPLSVKARVAQSEARPRAIRHWAFSRTHQPLVNAEANNPKDSNAPRMR